MSDEHKVFIRGFQQGVTEQDVREFFKACGDIVDVRIVDNPAGPFGFVGFETADGHDAALKLDGGDFQGGSLQVQRKIQRQEKQCFRCGSSSHMSRDCPQSERLCFRCKCPGHLSKDCTAPFKRHRSPEPPRRDDRDYRRHSPRDDRDYRRRSPRDDRDYRRRSPRDDRDYRRRSPRDDRERRRSPRGDRRSPRRDRRDD